MAQVRQMPRWGLWVIALWAMALLSGTSAPSSDDLQTVLSRPIPRDLHELRAIEQRVQEIAERALPATVSVQVGSASGSGVVISEDGFVLTAGHVLGSPGRDAIVLFPDGRAARAITLGMNLRMDSGLLQIVEEGDWPHVPMADDSSLRVGQWCVAVGHPGGFDAHRPGVVRLGRIIRFDSFMVQSDCTLVGGDSGGPLFDMDGRVIGIHSRIGSPSAANFHVPIETYRLTWQRLKRGDAWGVPQSGGPFIGINGEDHPRGCRITQTVEDTPAHRAGLRIGDVITHSNGIEVRGYASFIEMVGMMEVGDKLPLTIERNNRPMTVTITVGARP